MRPPPRGLVPFRIDVPPRVLDDLAERVARARLPGAPVDAGRDYGIEPGYLFRLVDYRRAFVGVPTAFVARQHDLFPAPPTDGCSASVRRTDLTVGGHLLAYERPAEFVEDVRAFFRDYGDGRSV